jgi:hypothetical protein
VVPGLEAWCREQLKAYRKYLSAAGKYTTMDAKTWLRTNFKAERAAMDDESEIASISGGPSQPRGMGGAGVTKRMQPGGVGTTNDLDDAAQHPHGAILSDAGFAHVGGGQYQHEDGRTATTDFDDGGAPRTKLSTGEVFDDEDDLRVAVNPGVPKNGLRSDMEQTGASFMAKHGHSLEATEHVMRERRAFQEFKAHSNSELSFSDWLRYNPMNRGGNV